MAVYSGVEFTPSAGTVTVGSCWNAGVGCQNMREWSSSAHPNSRMRNLYPWNEMGGGVFGTQLWVKAVDCWCLCQAAFHTAWQYFVLHWWWFGQYFHYNLPSYHDTMTLIVVVRIVGFWILIRKDFCEFRQFIWRLCTVKVNFTKKWFLWLV